MSTKLGNNQYEPPSTSQVKRAVEMVASGRTKTEACRTTGVGRGYLNRALGQKELVPKFSWRSDSEKQRAIELYEKGIVPKRMHEYGVTASWPTIYKWVKEAGCKTIRYNTRGKLREEYVKADFPEEEWKAYSKLVRRLSNDIYREHRDEIDPFRLRGMEWHMDHRTSIYAAFLKGWPPERTAHRRNLQMLPERVNRRKYTN
jgi:hypothetical protein